MNTPAKAPPGFQSDRHSRATPRSRPVPLSVRLARARMVLLRRREDPFGWLSLCLFLVLSAAALAAVPGPAFAAGAVPEALLLVPRTGTRLPVEVHTHSGGLQVTALRRVLEELVENDLVCIQERERPLSWYRVLRLGGSGPVHPGALLLDGRASGPVPGAEGLLTAVALPVAPPGWHQPSTNRASMNPR